MAIVLKNLLKTPKYSIEFGNEGKLSNMPPNARYFNPIGNEDKLKSKY